MEQATAKAACRARNLTYVTAQPYYTPYMVPLTGLHTETVKKQGQYTRKPSASHPPQHHCCKPSRPCEP
ncbi:TPA: hypothetical protein ACH3X3_006857 [Trebouxia sp. C0006]